MKTFKTSLLTIVTLLCSIVASAHDFEVDGIYYNVTSDSDLTVEVTYKGDSYSKSYTTGDVIIPESVVYDGNTYSVKSIKRRAFYHCSNLKSVTIPNSVSRIEEEAFEGCSNLVDIAISNSVTNIGRHVFYTTGWWSNQSIGLLYLDNYLLGYKGVSDYETGQVEIKDGTKVIADDAFEYCSKITGITIPNSVTSIGDWAFCGCSGLTSITIPNSVTYIGEKLFASCSNLTSIVVETGNKYYDSRDNCNAIIETNSNTLITGCLSTVIPNSVTSIENGAFAGCSALISIIIPNSVTSIGNDAFASCSALTNITIPNSVTSIGDAAFYDCTSFTSITIPNSVTNIGEQLFSGCSNLTKVTIPNSVTSIGVCAFYGCTNLTNITIPNSVTSIGGQAFRGTGWWNKQSDGLVYLNNYLLGYKGNEPTGEIEIRNGTKTIADGALSWCTRLTSITIPNSVTSIEDDAFYHCFALTNITIPNSVTNIGNRAFYGCSGLTSITIPNSVMSIGRWAFSGCSGLTSVTIPNSVTSIGNAAFSSCSNLTSIVVDTENKYYDSRDNCNAIIETDSNILITGCSSTIIPNSVMSIGNLAFSGCSALTSITIPNLVKNIENKAFNGCSNLTNVYCYAEKIPTTNSGAFTNSNIENATLHVPDSSYYDYKEANVWKDFGTITTLSGNIPAFTHQLIYMVDGVEYKRIEKDYKDTITLEEPLFKEGYTFSGWSEVPVTMPLHDVTVEGSFSINSYTLLYTVDGEEYKTITVEYGAEIVPEAEPVKEGYTFSGWNEVPATMPANDVTVEGTFTINSYTLLYTVDGEEYKTVTVEYGAEIILEAEPTKEGYTFSGWSEVPATMPAKDVTVEGTFTINSYTLLYMVDGEEYKTVTVEYGTELVPDAEPIKEGYTFSGWSEIPTTMPANDVTVEGSFTINSYTLLYIVDGEEYKTVTVEYGAEIVPEAEPTKEGYTFSGWSEVPATMPAHDVTIEGTFTKVDGIEVVLTNKLVDVYTLQGVKIREQIPVESLKNELPRGVYIVNGKKVVVR